MFLTAVQLGTRGTLTCLLDSADRSGEIEGTDTQALIANRCHAASSCRPVRSDRAVSHGGCCEV